MVINVEFVETEDQFVPLEMNGEILMQDGVIHLYWKPF